MAEASPPMAWRRWCRDASIRCEGDSVTIAVTAGTAHRHPRTQTVRIRASEGGLLLESVAAHRRHVSDPDATQGELWLRNRAHDLISVSLDPSGKIVASCWLPGVALDRDEFLFALHQLAAEADRIEYLLTGSVE